MAGDYWNGPAYMPKSRNVIMKPPANVEFDAAHELVDWHVTRKLDDSSGMR
jgi:hypothetical protein